MVVRGLTIGSRIGADAGGGGFFTDAAHGDGPDAGPLGVCDMGAGRGMNVDILEDMASKPLFIVSSTSSESGVAVRGARRR